MSPLIRTATVFAIAASLAGCVVNRYPVIPALAATDGSAMTCTQLNSELASARRTQSQIDDIAAGRLRGVRPTLYSTARSDADRAAEARVNAIEALRQQKSCAA